MANNLSFRKEDKYSRKERGVVKNGGRHAGQSEIKVEAITTKP